MALSQGKSMARNWTTSIAAVLLAGSAFTASAENGVTDSTILIGQTVALTGQIASSVKEMNEGAKAYIDAVNRQGGIYGRRIEIRTLDDKFKPALSAANAEILINKDHVFAMFQNRGTPHTEAILPILAANDVPLVAPSTGAAIFHTPVNHLIFNVRAKYQAEVAKAIEHFTTVGFKRIGIVHVDDSFGNDALAGFNDAMTARKLTPSVIVSFDRAKPDIAATAAAANKGDSHALIIVGSATSVVALIKTIRKLGNHAQLMTLSNNSSQAFVKSLGEDGVGVIVSQISPAPDLVTTRLGQEFQADAKVTGGTVSYAAMEGFISAKVLVEGLRRAGRNLTREGFVHALESIHKLDLGGVMITYTSDDHTGSEFVEMTMIGRGGRFVR
jgi:ABC-type branched-subunit amino acid transport system substrate-binding protein